ncbi:MAG TPA: Gfo/Idh/MocA family oxidoreductase [Bryobacteraceae bacterium]|nr:Gfo/Idh/MocA family oxidoreductase [Bryobacteraceae bacterium]
MKSRREFLGTAAAALGTPLAAQESYKLAVIGLVHSHVWGHLGSMLKGEHAQLAGIAETIPALVAEAKRRGATNVPFFSDYLKMLDELKPNIAWAFVENDRHAEIVEACARRGIHVIFEKPLAATNGQAREIARLSREHGIQVMTNYQMAWWPANYAAKTAADSGELGQVWRLRGIVGHGGPGSPEGLNKYFFEWLTDPVKNGAGSLMDFGCYNALWSLWYLGMPERVYAQVNHLRPQTFPKVEDNADLMLSYKNGVGIYEASWDLPNGYQDLEVFGLKGSVYMKNGSAELRKGRETQALPLEPLPPDRAEPLAYMTSSLKAGKPLEGLTALEINVGVVEIIEAAKKSVETGKAISLPIPA